MTLEQEWDVKEPEGFNDVGRLIFKVTLEAMKWEELLNPPSGGDEQRLLEQYRGKVRMGVDLLATIYPLHEGERDDRSTWMLMLLSAYPHMTIE